MHFLFTMRVFFVTFLALAFSGFASTPPLGL
jgi:hypothetical protein